MSFGSIIRKLREDRRWTQAEFGAMLGKSESWVSRLEKNDWKNLKQSIKVKMAAKFEMDTIELERILYSKGGDIEVNLQRNQLVRTMQMQQRQWGTATIPLLGTYPGSKITTGQQAIGVIIMPITEFRGSQGLEAVYAIRVEDDSLVGRGIKRGDYLLVDPDGVVEDGRLYIVDIKGREDIQVVNLYRRRAGFVAIVDVSNNQLQEHSEDDLHIEGRVLMAGGFRHF